MSCGLNCRFAQKCHFRTAQPKSGDPEDCSEWIKLEDYWWDAQNEREYDDEDELPFMGDEEEEEVEEDDE